MKEKDEILKLVAMIHEKYPFVMHTDAGRLYSTVRRMKAEKEYGIPIHLRKGFVTSVESGIHVDDMLGEQWEEFYAALCQELARKYPELHAKLFKNERSDVS